MKQTFTLITPDEAPIVVKRIRTELKNYLVKCGIKSLVVGMSGGIDSAVCAGLASSVCQELKIPLVGRSLPIISSSHAGDHYKRGNRDEEIDNARKAGEQFCSDFKEVDLSNSYEKLWQEFQKAGGEDYSVLNDHELALLKGNIKARTRMVYLYHLAGVYKGMVLSTDNLTELLLGFWTLHGDVGDYGMIQNLWKSEVYLVGKALNVPDSIIKTIPTDGLGISQSDVAQLGAKDYAEVDKILQDHLADNTTHTEHPVIKRYHSSHFKRSNPLNLERELILQDVQ